MRKFFLSALLFAGIGVSMISCSNGDYTATPAGGTNWNPGSGGNGGGSTAGNMAAKINGSQWNSSNGVSTSQGGAIVIGGSNSSGNAVVSLMIFNYTGPGTYAVNTATTITYLAGSTPTMMTSGQIVVSTDQNNNVQGTFSGAGNGTTIENGTFNVNKQ